MNSSTFEIGSPIVHPIHGAGILKEVAKKTIRGKLMSYYVIDFPYSDLGQVMVPVDMAEKARPSPRARSFLNKCNILSLQAPKGGP